mmetsp:Transcript_11002/g.23322  ORF Transcript_11002/g.23322 Transcript_11002/m.23322 type:complete len:359 (+) Transcript_11002:565-1641(+)
MHCEKNPGCRDGWCFLWFLEGVSIGTSKRNKKWTRHRESESSSSSSLLLLFVTRYRLQICSMDESSDDCLTWCSNSPSSGIELLSLPLALPNNISAETLILTNPSSSVVVLVLLPLSNENDSPVVVRFHSTSIAFAFALVNVDVDDDAAADNPRSSLSFTTCIMESAPHAAGKPRASRTFCDSARSIRNCSVVLWELRSIRVSLDRTSKQLVYAYRNPVEWKRGRHIGIHNSALLDVVASSCLSIKFKIRCISETRNWCGRNDGCTTVNSLSPPTTNSAKAMLFSIFLATLCNAFEALCRIRCDIGKHDRTLETKNGPVFTLFPSGPLLSSIPRRRLSSLELLISDLKSKPGLCRNAF